MKVSVNNNNGVPSFLSDLYISRVYSHQTVVDRGYPVDFSVCFLFYFLPPRCLRCRRLGHLARHCNRPRHGSSVPRGNGGHQARHYVRVADGVAVGTTQPVTHGDSLDYGGVCGRRHQKLKRKHKLPTVQVQPRESPVGTGCQNVAMANTTAAATSPANRGEPRRVGMPSGTLSDVDPSMLPLRFDVGQAGRDVADDPMLVELVASLHVIRTATAPALVVASLGRVDAAFSEDEGPRPLASPSIVVGRRWWMSYHRVASKMTQ